MSVREIGLENNRHCKSPGTTFKDSSEKNRRYKSLRTIVILQLNVELITKMSLRFFQRLRANYRYSLSLLWLLY